MMNVVSRDEWLAARTELLEREKELTRARDALSAARRALPWVEVEDYVFEDADGPVRLSQLFDGRSQLVVQHFMYGAGWDAGCPSCSFWADGFDPAVVHLNARDISFAAISRGPLSKLHSYRDRMGWRFRWVSSLNSTFNQDFNVSFSADDIAAGTTVYNYRSPGFPGPEAPGVSAFKRGDDGRLFHTYSCYSRGLDTLNTAYHLMDLTADGRNEGAMEFPMAWLRRRDEYGA